MADAQLPGSFDTSDTVRALLTPFDFDADNPGIVTSGYHTVEVVVGEKTGFDDIPPPPG